MREESVKFLPQPISSVWVRDPKMQKNDFWNAYIDYEVCLQTNSVCFTKKISSVRRRYSEFVWLRQKLQENSMLMVELPALPPKTPFFSMNNARQVSHRMKGLQRFLEQILQSAQLLSDSCLHLFLQSQLSVAKMEACAAGRTHYSVAQAVSCCGLRRFHSEEELHKHLDVSCDSESDCSDCKHPEDQNENSSEEKAEESVLFDLLQNSQEETLSCSSGST